MGPKRHMCGSQSGHQIRANIAWCVCGWFPLVRFLVMRYSSPFCFGVAAFAGIPCSKFRKCSSSKFYTLPFCTTTLPCQLS